MTRHSNLCGQSAWRWVATGEGGRFEFKSGRAWEVAGVKPKAFLFRHGDLRHTDQRCCKPFSAAGLHAHLQNAVIGLLCTISIAACATPPELGATAISPEKMLSALVGLATDEDLVDHERVAKLLNLRLEMKADSPQRFMEDGRLIRGATAEEPVDPGYFPAQGKEMYYRVVTEPVRSANFAINFDRTKLCMNIDDVHAQFRKHGELRQSPPPLPHAPPPGEVRQQLTIEQPVYGYAFKGSRKTAVLTFSFSKCLTRFSTFQTAISK